MKLCRECGTLSSDDTVFCYICGTKFHKNDAEERNFESDDSLNNNNDLVTDSPSIYENNPSALKMNGVYYYIEGGIRYLLRFNPDGTVLGTSDTNAMIQSASEICAISYRDQGWYSIENNQISFSLISPQGQVDYWGQVLYDELLLNLHSHINGYQASNKRYQFVKI